MSFVISVPRTLTGKKYILLKNLQQIHKLFELSLFVSETYSKNNFAVLETPCINITYSNYLKLIPPLSVIIQLNTNAY